MRTDDDAKPPRSRTIRLDIAQPIYENLDAQAVEQDIGLSTLIRRILIEWAYEHPPPSDS